MQNKKPKFNIVINPTSKKAFVFLITSNILFFSAYLFFVGATTVEVVNRKNIEEQTKTLQSTMATLEESYNGASKIYTKDYAKTLGFIEAVPMFYATASTTTVAYDQGR